jgi:hypothetical protein
MRLRIRETFPMAGMRSPRWIVERKRLWWWVQVGPAYSSEQDAKAALAALDTRCS